MDCRNEGVSIIIVFVTTCYKHSSPPTEALRSVRRLGCSKIYGLTDLTGGLPLKRNAIERRWYSENDRHLSVRRLQERRQLRIME